ncbi:MAG TPA: copper homeostasis protein CutC [Tepiditoga sp.]|nr:copper homeostasis protein CutC [Tepiditoga sp.]
MIIEICVENFHSAVIAQNAGAQRIEICSALALGGLTPDIGFVEAVADKIKIKKYVMIRPRNGNFLYNEYEFENIMKNIKIIKKYKIDGFVCGILTKEGNVDDKKMKIITEEIYPFNMTFHRAFDCTVNLYEAAESIINLGIERILTSGGKNTAEEGIENIKKINDKYGSEVKIMAGSGISAENVLEIASAGVKEIHFSAKKKIPVKSLKNIRMGNSEEEYFNLADEKIIKEIKIKTNGKIL